MAFLQHNGATECSEDIVTIPRDLYSGANFQITDNIVYYSVKIVT